MKTLKSVKQLNDSPQAEQNSAFRLLGVDIWNGSMHSAVSWLVNRIQNKLPTQVAFANANNLNIAFEEPLLKSHLNECERVFADGSGIRLAAKACGVRVQDNVNGTDMFPLLCEALQENKKSIFLLGAQRKVIESAVANIKQQYPSLIIAGYHHGYFSSDEFSQQKVIRQINRSAADMLVVAMGTPVQENWLSKFATQIAIPVRMSVGGLFDFISGKNSRAPKLMRSLGVEWIWRMAQEPARMWRRYILGNPLFVYRVFKRHVLKPTKQTIVDNIDGSYSLLKRCCDFIVAGLIVTLLAPFLAAVALAIRFDSRGPILFSQTRIGKNGKQFRFWKFRSMITTAPDKKEELAKLNESQDQVLFKMKQDPRITSVGRFIRKFSIDELPQLWNVLKGDMSLVGPRPALPEEVEKYSKGDKLRLKVKPGLTCFWQVLGRSDLSFRQQVQLDQKYIKERSLLTDLKILLLTIPAVVSGKGAY